MTSIQTAVRAEERPRRPSRVSMTIQKIDTAISLAESSFDAAQKDYAKKLSLISDLNKALDNCEESNEATREAITNLRSALNR